jgi:hypothetical protein
MITFEEATEQTKALYEKAKKLYGDDLNAAFNQNKEDFWADVHKWDLETLIERSVSNADIFDILIRSISKILEEQKLLCALSRDWLVKFLRGEVKRPKEIAGRKDTSGRDSFIVFAMQRLKNQGMPVSPRTPAAATSACEVLAQVIKPFVSEKTINNIWNDRPKGYVFGRIDWEQDLGLFGKTLSWQK